MKKEYDTPIAVKLDFDYTTVVACSPCPPPCTEHPPCVPTPVCPHNPCGD